MDMTTTKTVVVFAIIFGCFAILYPKIFHPMLLHVLGVSSPKQGTDDISAAFSQVNRVPPHLRKGPGPARVIPGGDEISRQMRPGPHPGLRAAAEMKKQTTTTTGSGKGMMGVVLPMYAVGIVIYLIYTLSKVFGKKEEKKEDFLSNNPFSEIHYDPVQKQFHYNEESDEEAKEEKKRQEKKSRQRDLERLLLKADERNISYKQLCDQILQQSTKVFESEAEIEMRQLKERLLETEAQMSRILKAMEVVSDNVAAKQDSKESTPEKDVPSRPVDSSPDLDSYEIINGESSTSRGNPDGNVEDIGPQEENVSKGTGESDYKQVEENTADGEPGGEDQGVQEEEHSREAVESAEVSPKHVAVLEEGDNDTVEQAEDGQEEVVEEMIPEKKEEDNKDEPRPDLRKRKSKKPRKDN